MINGGELFSFFFLITKLQCLQRVDCLLKGRRRIA